MCRMGLVVRRAAVAGCGHLFMEPTLSIPKAIVAGLLFMFTNREGVQPFLTVLVLLGIAKTLKDSACDGFPCRILPPFRST